MIERAISNLIQNALKFSSKGSTVALEIERKHETVEVKVRDNGPGIPKNDLPHIFERFYRVDKSRNRASGGSCLGLAIVKKIIEAHEQQISVQSDAQSGTVFSFKLPIWKKKVVSTTKKHNPNPKQSF